MQITKDAIVGGFSLEAVFDGNGYSVSWDNTIALTHVERRFLSSYMISHGRALVELGLSNPPQRSLSPSMRTLYAMADAALKLLRESDDTKSVYEQFLESNHGVSAKNMVTVRAAKNAVLSEIAAYLNGFSVTDSLQTTIDDIRDRVLAYTTLSFCIDENTDDGSLASISVRCIHNGVEVPVSEAVAALGERADDILGRLKRLQEASEMGRRVYNDGRIQDSVPLSFEDVGVFLNEMPLYETYGIACYIPATWKKRPGRFLIHAGLNNILGSNDMGANSLLRFDMKLMLDGEELTAEDIRLLLEQTDRLFLFRGKWIRINPDELRVALRMYKSALARQSNGLTLTEVMRASLAPEKILFPDESYGLNEILLKVDSSDWFDTIRSMAPRPAKLPDVSLSKDFLAKLRPYQTEGVNWLYSMYRAGLGACLSDDMGLGKTIEALAFFEILKSNGASPSLVIAPASLLNNWQNEISRFAPNLKFSVLHSSSGNMTSTQYSKETDLYITTYSMVSRIPWLFEHEWECVLADEAQAIKNPLTRQSRMVKKLKAKFRLAMTGTPIENSPLDLQSIFQFINPGFLDDTAATGDSREEYTNRMRELVRPFILRRLKTDKNVISDLPQKIEMKRYCDITPRQVLLYKNVVERLSDTIGEFDGIKRRGYVLSSILRLKQILNHPAQFLGEGEYTPEDSGKFKTLTELCSEIRDVGEKVLVFTQFRRMCEPLSNLLSTVFSHSGLVIHGGISVQDRGEIVRRFNDPDENIPYLVLSLRTAGVGLNLTAASHVIHFDRWWNPAVEDQATDRAFRIGQTKNVLVHKLICSGTLEEKIDMLIDEKRALADSIITSESDAITELSDDALIGLLTMGN